MRVGWKSLFHCSTEMRPRETTSPDGPDTATSPSGAAYRTYSPMSTTDFLFTHAWARSTRIGVKAAGSVPVIKYGVPLVKATTPFPVEAMSTMSSSRVIR